jgi:hypothetical protein
MRRFVSAALVVASLLVMALPASAHRTDVFDANDTDGRLDIRVAILKHRGEGSDLQLTFIVKTYGEWAKRHLRPGRGSITIEIKRSPEVSYRIEVTRGNDGKLYAIISLCSKGQCNPHAGPFRARHPNRRSLKFRVDRTDLEGIGATIRWQAQSAFGRGCDGNCFFDKAPNNHFARHELVNN